MDLTLKNIFLRRVGLLTSASLIGPLVVVLASPILTRLYGPDEFGVFSIFVAMLSLILIVSGLRFELAIPLPRLHTNALYLMALALWINALIAIIFALFLVFVREPIAAMVKSPGLASYAWALPIAIFLAGSYRTFSCWAVRHHNYRGVALTKLSQSVISIAVQLAAGIMHLGVFGLIMGFILGQVVGTISLLRFAKNTLPRKFHISVRRMRVVAHRQLNFVRYDVPASLIDTASEQMPSLLLAIFFGPAIAGYYMLAQRALSLPSAAIGQAMGQVLYGQCRQAIEERRLGRLVRRMVFVILGTILIPTMIVMGWGGEIFELIFGAAWRQSGQFAAWLVIGIAVQLAYSPISMALMATEGQHINLVIHSVLLVTRLACLLWGWLHGDAMLAIALLSLASFFGYALGIFLIIKRTQVWTPDAALTKIG